MTDAGSGRAAGRQRIRFIVALVLFGLAAFWIALHLAGQRPAPPIHPLTGRQIAGIATDAGWLDRTAGKRRNTPSWRWISSASLPA